MDVGPSVAITLYSSVCLSVTPCTMRRRTAVVVVNSRREFRHYLNTPVGAPLPALAAAGNCFPAIHSAFIASIAARSFDNALIR